MPKRQSFEFIEVMTHYGIRLGFLIGCVGSIPIALMWFKLSILLPVLALIVVITMCGGLIGIVYGAVSGFISGVLMRTTTRFIFPQISQQTLYKITMGGLALGTTALVFLADFIWIGTYKSDVFSKSIQLNDWIAICIMSLVFAVYASQRTATQYLQEADYLPVTRR